MLHAVSVRAVKIREPAPEIGCERLRGIGYSWRCSCGERGPIMASHRSARNGGAEHRASQSGRLPA